MTRIRLLAENLDVQGVLDGLLSHPEFWNENTERTSDKRSPHHGLDDIWARFAKDKAKAHDFHDAVWYPSADVVPIRELADEVLKVYPGKLGGVLITRIRPGKLCKPHTDAGWHAQYYDKVGVSITANSQQAFCFDDEFLVTKPGDAFWFDNGFTHWVPNVSNEDRITAFFCIRPENKEA